MKRTASNPLHLLASLRVGMLLVAGCLGTLGLVTGPARAQEATPQNLGFEDAPQAHTGHAPAWEFLQHAVKPSFDFAVDDKVAKEGRRSLRIRRTGPDVFGLVSQRVRADRYRGKRVRVSAFLQLDQVEPYGRGPLRDISGATLMVRTEGTGVLTLDDMRDRPLRGTKSWTEASVEVDVPQAASVVEFAAALSGTGTLWADAFRIEIVDAPKAAKGAAR